MMRYKGLRFALMLGSALPAALALTACGDSGGVSSTPTPTPVAPTPVPPPPPPPPPPTTNYNTTEYQRSNGAAQANAISAYNAGATGAGIKIAVIDSGIISTETEVVSKLDPLSADVAGSRGVPSAEDWHGTAVAAVALSARDAVYTHGVAFDATLLAFRADTVGSCAAAAATAVTTDGCTFNDNAIAAGVDRAVTGGARVINISLGGSPANRTLANAIDRATAAGVIIVISAGNEFDTDPTNAVNPDPLAQIAIDPAAHGLVLIAGAVDTNNVITAFSNRAGNSAAYYLTALGVGIRAHGDCGTGGAVVSCAWTGTSFSAPIVSGAVALLAQAFPNLSSTQIVDLLLKTAVDLGAVGTDSVYGRGALDIARAFAPQGTLSLAGSAIAIQNSASSTLSPAMGDATSKGLAAVVLDGYGRAYTLDLGSSISRGAITPTLAPGLGIGSHSSVAGSPNTAISLSVADSSTQSSVEHWLLSAQDVKRSRALAGAIIAKVDARSAFGLGIRQSSASLSNSLNGKQEAAWLIGERAGRGWGFQAQSDAAFAFRHGLGATGLTLSAESGEARLWRPTAPETGRSKYGNYSYSAVKLEADGRFDRLALSGGLSSVVEKETVLGAHFGGFAGKAGAQTIFADAGARLDLGHEWGLSGAYRRGWTRVTASGIRAGTDHLTSSAWSVDLAKTGIVMRGDRLGLRVAQPLRIAHGGFDLTVPVGYDYQTLGVTYGHQFYSLAPTGREIDVEALWSAQIGQGWLATNFFWRKQPGNIATNPSDKGAAVRYTLGF